MIRAARAWSGLRNAEEFGLRIAGEVGYDFAAAMARMRRLRARISNNDSVERYTCLGVDPISRTLKRMAAKPLE
ncbi:MAG: hypothetical protein ACHBNF_18030 [Chromatiales bacterium]